MEKEREEGKKRGREGGNERENIRSATKHEVDSVGCILVSECKVSPDTLQ